MYFQAVVTSSHLSSPTHVAVGRGPSGPSGRLVQSFDTENHVMAEEDKSLAGEPSAAHDAGEGRRGTDAKLQCH